MWNKVKADWCLTVCCCNVEIFYMCRARFIDSWISEVNISVKVKYWNHLLVFDITTFIVTLGTTDGNRCGYMWLVQTILLCVCFSCDSGGDCECLCTAIAAYAEECSRRGVYIRWRSQELCRTSKSNDTQSHPRTHSVSPLCRRIYPYLTVFL